MKKLLASVLIGCFFFVMLFSGCSSEKSTTVAKESMLKEDAPQETVSLKIAAQGAEDHAFMLGLRMLEKDIESKSNGHIQLEIFPNASLGNERETIEATMMGSIEMTIVTADAVVPSWVPETQVLSIPYLFENKEQTYDVLDNFLKGRFEPKFNDAGLVNLGFMELGFRHFTNNKAPIQSAADMKGMVFRVQEAPIWFSLIEALGATPTPVAFPELYTAMQQGVIDGQENPLSTIVSSKYYEVQKYLVLDRHTYAAGTLLMNKKSFDSLTEEDKALLTSCVNDMIAKQRQLINDKDEEYIKTCRDAGMEVVEDPDIDSFREATKGIEQRDEIKSLFDVSIVDEVKAYLQK